MHYIACIKRKLQWKGCYFGLHVLFFKMVSEILKRNFAFKLIRNKYFSSTVMISRTCNQVKTLLIYKYIHGENVILRAYSPSLHTSRRSWYLTTFRPPFPFGKLSPMIEVNGESSSSSSSSLVYAFLSTDDPLLRRDWLPTSPKMPEREAAAAGGE